MPAAVFTESERGGTAAIMKNQGLMVIFEILLDIFEQNIGKIAIFGEIGAIFEVDNGDFGVDGGGFGAFGEFNQGMMGASEVIIDEIRGG